jgi:hypothetical protein
VKWGWHDSGGSSVDIAADLLMDSLVNPMELYLPPLSRASVGIWQMAPGSYAQFHIGPTSATLLIDLLHEVAGDVLGKVGSAFAGPLLGACGTSLAEAEPLSDLTSPIAIFDALLNVVPCAEKAVPALVSSGLLASADADRLTATLGAIKKASVVGNLVEVYNVEWDLLDIFIDHAISGSSVLGAGFSVLAASSASQPTSPPDAPAPAQTPLLQPTSPPSTPPPTPTTTPAPPSTEGFTIDDSFYGGTWARTDPNDGTWYAHSQPPPNAAYWYPNGLGVAVDCVREAAPYDAVVYDQHQTWYWWAHVTDGKWVPVVVFSTVWSDGDQGLAHC